ncbi:type II toxin-antitoxin system PemK/MazF family toxin [Paenibacillus glucanolyticus]|uniref:type II toxin-antitoxin system PemK/MazF family toxin n=1 Tax=Paenibacillus glucanolyticus TaxID=59843 RepID=UPI0030D4EDC8
MKKIELNHNQTIDKRSVKRGQIYTANMSFTYKSNGTYGKTFERLLVIQNNRGNHFSPTIIALTIKNGVVDLYSMNTIDKKRLISLVGSIEEHKMNLIDVGLRNLLIGEATENLIAL